jgi:glycine cleavage system transcriptional repressor
VPIVTSQQLEVNPRLSQKKPIGHRPVQNPPAGSGFEALLTDDTVLILDCVYLPKVGVDFGRAFIGPSANIGVSNMNKTVITVLGQDRPGIVASTAKILVEQDCNIENVSQTILQNEFTGIFIVSMPPGLSPEALRTSLQTALSAMDLHVHVKALAPAEPIFSPQCSEPFVITTRGPDRKGLVAGISEIIARYGVNITNLQAVFKGGSDPMDNIMIYEVDVLAVIDQPAFHQALKQRAVSLSLDIDIQHRNIFEVLNRI